MKKESVRNRKGCEGDGSNEIIFTSEDISHAERKRKKRREIENEKVKKWKEIL